MSTTVPISSLENLYNNSGFKYADLKVIRQTKNSSLSVSQFKFTYQINHCFSSQSSSQSPTLLEYVPAFSKIPLPFDILTLCESDSLFHLSTLLTIPDIPFPHTTLVWKPTKNSNKPDCIQSLDDLIRHVFHEMCSIGSEVEQLTFDQDSKVVVDICLILERSVVLSDEVFEALRQRFINEKRGLEDMTIEYRTRDDFSIQMFREFVFNKRGLVMKEEMIDQLMEVVLKERLLKKVETLTLNQDCEELCSICHEKLRDDDDDEDKLIKTPCSHLFHENCIMKWMKTNNACPMCRFRF